MSDGINPERTHRRMPVVTAAAAWLLTLLLLQCSNCRQSAAAPPWLEQSRLTHARFSGRAGTLGQFGDSITVTQAFWSPLKADRRKAPAAMERAFREVDGYLAPECWRDWKGPEFGSDGGKTIRWAHENLDAWLRKLNPEAAVIMFGTNDLHQMDVEEYRTKLRDVLRRCGENGTVAIVTTIPPRHGFEKKAAEFAQAGRDVAGDLRLPLIDYHAGILKRRPEDWDGSLERFDAFEGYEVPTLISRDGVHPSLLKRYQDDYSEEGLRSSGYTLRNYLTLLAYAEVLQAFRRPAAAAVRLQPGLGARGH